MWVPKWHGSTITATKSTWVKTQHLQPGYDDKEKNPETYINKCKVPWVHTNNLTFPSDDINKGRCNIREIQIHTIAILSTHRSLWHILLAHIWQAGVTKQLSKSKANKFFDILSLIRINEPMLCPATHNGIKYWAMLSSAMRLISLLF